jgi:branched-chain amino acid transport system permease protein
MEQIILFMLFGLGPGSLIAALAIGIVLFYRGRGVINVATGAVAMVAAFVFYGLRTGGYLFLPPFKIPLDRTLQTLPAFAITIAVCVVLGMLLEILVHRPLRNTSPLAKLVASVGVLLTFQAMVVLQFGSSGQRAPEVISSDPVAVFGLNVPGDRLVLAAIVIGVAVVLSVVYRRTRFGLSTRAVAENEVLAGYAGLAADRVSMVNTLLGVTLVGVLGVLVAPLSQLDATGISMAVVPALGAALLARFTSFGVAVAAGLLMGVLQSLVTYASVQSWFPKSDGIPMPGISELLFFIIIVLALLWRGGAIPARGSLIEQRLPAAPKPTRTLIPTATLGVLAALALVYLPPDFRQPTINSLIGILVCLSLVVTTGFVGQISLMQIGLGGVAGFTVSKLAIETGIGFPIGPLLAVGLSTVVGLAFALPAVRVRGVNLAIVTLAGAVALEKFVFQNSAVGGGLVPSLVPAPELFGINLGPQAAFPLGDGKLPSPVFGFVCLAAVIGCAHLVFAVRRGDIGRRMLAVRSNERAATAAGLPVTGVKLAAFGISSFIAGIAGVLYSYGFGSVTSSRFGLLVALAFVAFAYLGGITSVMGAVVGGLLVTQGLAAQAINDWFGISPDYQLVVAGLALVLTIVTNPEGIVGGVSKLTKRVKQRRAGQPQVAVDVVPATSGKAS